MQRWIGHCELGGGDRARSRHGSLAADRPRRRPLREALVTTYLTSPRLEAGRSELRQVDELVPQALSGYRPSVFLNGDLTGEQEHDPPGQDVIARRTGPARASISPCARTSTPAAARRPRSARRRTRSAPQRARLYALEQQVLLDAVDAYTAAYRDQSCSIWRSTTRSGCSASSRPPATGSRSARSRVPTSRRRRPACRGRAPTSSRPRPTSPARARFYERVVGEAPSKLEEPEGPHASCPRPRARPARSRRENPDIIAATFDLYAARDNVDVAVLEPAAEPRSSGRGRLRRRADRQHRVAHAPRSLGLNLVGAALPGRRRVFAGPREPPAGAAAA